MRVRSTCRPVWAALWLGLAVAGGAAARELVGRDGPPAWRAQLAELHRGGRQVAPPTIEKNITQTPGAEERDACWSASGNLIAFASNRAGDFDIYISRPDGSHPDSGAALTPKLVSGLAGDERYPAWSPGGTELAYTRGSDIFIRNLQTGIEAQVNVDVNGTLDVGQPTGLVFSFGGNRLAFSSRIGTNPSPQIYWISLNPNNRALVQITDSTGSNVAPAWFPRSDSILFASSRGGDFDIYQVDTIPGPGAPPVPDNQHRLVIQGTGHQTEPAWVTAGGISDPGYNQPFHLLYADNADSGGLHYDVKVSDGLGIGETVPTPTNQVVFSDLALPSGTDQSEPFANPIQAPSNNLCVFSGAQTGAFDLYTIEIFDGSPPILAGIDPTDGNFKPLVPTVSPQQTFPNSQITISAPLFDAGSGVAEAYALIRLADEPVYQRSGTTTGNNTDGVLNGGDLLIEGNNNVEYGQLYVNVPASTGGALVTRSPIGVGVTRAGLYNLVTTIGLPLDDSDADGVWTGTWTTPSEPHDYYVDIVPVDARGAPGNFPFDGNLGVNNRPGGGNNELVRIQQGMATPFWVVGYDRVAGFTTKQLDLTRKVLIVSDYAAGQAFQTADFAGAAQTTLSRFWPAAIPTEHYYFTDDDRLNHSPTGMSQFFLTGSSPPSPELIANRYLNTIWPYADGEPANDFSSSPSLVEEPLNVFGGPATNDLPAVWRVLCRGPVDAPTYNAYAPVGLTQPAGSPIPAQDADRMILWLSPYTGDLFVGPGTLLDAEVQSALEIFVQSGGRLFISGQDIAWALTKNGTQTSAFLRDTLRATFVSDAPPDVANQTVQGGNDRREFNVGSAIVGIEQQVFQTTQNPITHDLYPDFFRWTLYLGDFHPPDDEENVLRINGGGARGGVGWAGAGCPNQWFIDDIQPASGGTATLSYRQEGQTAMVRHLDATSGGRVVYAAYGFEAQRNNFRLYPGYTTNTDWIIAHNDRPEMMTNISDYLRTGALLGKVVGPDGSTPAAGITVEARLGPNATGAAMSTTTTLQDGTYLLRGLSTANYGVYVVSSEFTADHRPYQPVFGGQTSQDSDLTIRLLRFETGTVFGTVTDTSGATVAGATVKATLQTTGNNPLEYSVQTDNNGAYSLAVPGGTYSVTASATGFGSATATNIQVVAGDFIQVDLVLQPEPGTITGKVTSEDTGQPIAGARVAVLLAGLIQLTGTTDSAGVYALDIGPGTYKVQVSAAGFETAERDNVQVKTDLTTAGIDFVLKSVPPGALVGLITVQGSSDPAGGVDVRLLVNGAIVRTVTSSPTTTSADGDVYNYRFDDVPAGTYDVQVAAKGFTAPTRSAIQVTSGRVTTGVDFVLQPLHIFVQGLTMVSAPFGYQQVAPDIQQILDDDNDRGTRLAMAAYDTQRGSYTFYPDRPADTIRLGTGYFMKLKKNVPLTVEGTRAPTIGQGQDVQLLAGWNLIGHVYEFSVDLFECKIVFQNQVYGIQEAAARGLVNASLFTLNFGEYQQVFRLDPYTGYWLRAFQNVVLRIPPTALRSVPEGRATRQATQPGDWTAELIATSASGLRARAAFGVHAEAADVYDARDRAQPPRPPVPSYLEIVFPHQDWGRFAGLYRSDVRGQQRRQTWDVEVHCDLPDESVELTWPSLGVGVPGHLRVVLEDLETGRMRSLRQVSSYRYVTGRSAESRSFRITVEPADDRLAIAAAGYRPSRGGGGELTFTLTGAATVDAVIEGPGGTAVRRLAQHRQMAAGSQSLSWDGRDAQGRAVPAGTYRIVLVGVSDIGEQVRAVRLIQHRR